MAPCLLRLELLLLPNGNREAIAAVECPTEVDTKNGLFGQIRKTETQTKPGAPVHVNHIDFFEPPTARFVDAKSKKHSFNNQ